MLYLAEQRIHTLAKNFVSAGTASPSEFTVEDVAFSVWRVTRHDPQLSQKYWLATAEIEASALKQAWEQFWVKLARIVPRICVVSQCYTEYLGQPLLIRRADSDVAYVRWVGERSGTGLMFMEKQRKALEVLLTDPRIPDEFVWYWNDATNSTGYASKLLLMLSAVETLIKKASNKGKPEKDYDKLEHILGPDLKKDLWGTRDDPGSGLRHRLVHGEYF